MPVLLFNVPRHKTNAEVDWIGVSLASAAKITADRLARQYFIDRGYSEEEIDADFKQLLKGSGYCSHRNESVIEEQVDYLIPGFRQYFNCVSTHAGGMGYALMHRGRWSVQKDETKRFRTDIWRPFFDLITQSVDTGEPVTSGRRYAVHEDVIIVETDGSPGVYVRGCSEGSGWWYLGEAANQRNRAAGHLNSPLFLVRVYTTLTKNIAVSLQNSLFAKLDGLGIVRQWRGRSGNPACRGTFQLDRGIDLVGITDGLVREHYPEFCRQTVGPRV